MHIALPLSTTSAALAGSMNNGDWLFALFIKTKFLSGISLISASLVISLLEGGREREREKAKNLVKVHRISLPGNFICSSAEILSTNMWVIVMFLCLRVHVTIHGCYGFCCFWARVQLYWRRTWNSLSVSPCVPVTLSVWNFMDMTRNMSRRKENKENRCCGFLLFFFSCLIQQVKEAANSGLIYRIWLVRILSRKMDSFFSRRGKLVFGSYISMPPKKADFSFFFFVFGLQGSG